MFEHLSVNLYMISELGSLFDDLGEPSQILTPTSERPVVMHQLVRQLSFVLRGQGYAMIDGKEFQIRPGDLMIIAPGSEHAFYAPKGELELRHWHWPQASLTSDRYIIKEGYNFSINNMKE